jgi:dihydrofolate reductase
MTFRDNRNEIDAITSAGAYIMAATCSARPQSARAQARQAAADGRVAIAGGVATLNQYLSLGAIDELRLHRADVRHRSLRPTKHAVHVTLRPARR